MVLAELSQYRIEPGPLSPHDLQRFIDRLPANERAAIAWAPKSIRSALHRFYDEPISIELIAEVSAAVFRALHGCWSVILPLFIEQSVLRAELEGFWREKLSLLRGFISDPAAADGAEWAFRAVTSMFDLVSSVKADDVREGLNEIDETMFNEAARDQEVGGFMRAQVLLMSILEGAEGDLDPARAAELADWALLEAVNGVNALKKAGIRLNPFRGQTATERASRVLRYAEHARSSLSDEDMETLEDARIESL